MTRRNPMTDTVTAERSDLYIDVQVYGGSHIPDVIRQMVELANPVPSSIRTVTSPASAGKTAGGLSILERLPR